MTNDTPAAATDTADELDKKLAKKQKEAEAKEAIAKAQQGEAEAKAAKLKAEFPAGEAKPSEGKITTDEKAGYIATFAAYDALTQKAEEIANKIKDLPLGDARILIVDSLDFASADIQLIQVLKQIDFWDGEIKAQLDKIKEFAKEVDKIIKPPAPAKKKITKGLMAAPEAVSAGLQAAKGVISTLADIAGYFKIDFEVKGQAVDLSAKALQALIAGRIVKQNIAVFLPGFYRIEPAAPITVLDNFNQCISGKDRLKVAITELKEALTDPQMLSNKEANKTLIDEAEKACENAATLIKEFGEFNKALTTAPENGGHSPLASAALRQYLDDMGITHLLHLTVTSSGGEMVTGKGLFYFGSPGFLGACVVTYMLAKSTGEIVAADTVYGYSGIKYHLVQNKLESKRRQ